MIRRYNAGLATSLNIISVPACDKHTTVAGPERQSTDLTDERSRRLFEANPADFFGLYADPAIILNADEAEGIINTALDWLDANPLYTLTLAGRISRNQLKEALNAGNVRHIGVAVTEIPAPRLFKAVFEEDKLTGFVSSGGFVDEQTLLRACAAPDSTRGTQKWTALYRELLQDDAFAHLRIKNRDVFFNFMRALSSMTAKPINWAQIAQACGATGPTVRDWTNYLEKKGIVHIIEPLEAQAPRRAILRPKLYWADPGFALWFSESVTAPEESFVNALTENALFLTLFDAFFEARFLHFDDTNHVECPLIVESNGRRRGIFFAETDEAHKRNARYLKSLVKASLIENTALSIRRNGLAAASVLTYISCDSCDD